MRELLTFVEAARECGYAKIFETYESGTSAIAVPIVGSHSQRPFGTISVAGPVIRMTSEAMDAALPLLRTTAAAIAEAGEGLPLFCQSAH